MTETALQTERTVDTVTTEINTLHRQAQKMILTYAVEIGKRLVEVKGMLPHGSWGDYIRDRTPYSQSTVNNFMRIYEAYGDQNLSLFEESKPVGNLSYTQALELLALPSKDREDFIRENDVEEMSRRELKQAIRERNEAREEADRLRAAAQELEDAKGQLSVAEQSRKKMEEDMVLMNARMATMNQELQELRDKPVEVAAMEADPVELDKARQEGADQARQELQAKLEKMKIDLNKAKEKEKKAKEATKQAEERVTTLTAQAESKVARLTGEIDDWKQKAEKAQKVAESAGNQELATFKVLFEQIQQGVNQISMVLIEMESKGDIETASKVRRALSALAEAIWAEGTEREEVTP